MRKVAVIRMSRFLFLTAIFFLVLIFLFPKQALAIPVFPGAEGFGITTPAGRGGQVIRVTNLSDSESTAGSLRHALYRTDITGPRVIIFEVGGTINLSKSLLVKRPYVTIAGQTAPSPGITLAGDKIAIQTHDVLIQHLRVRTGDRGGSTSFGDRDALTVAGSTAVYNVVVDHCSFSWAIDENVSTWYSGLHDVTFSNIIISEGLNNAGHPDGGAHSMGFLIGDHSQKITVVRNLFAHNVNRNPGVKGDTTSVIVNNLIYNAVNRSIHFFNTEQKPGPVLSSIIGNVILRGLDSPSDGPPIELYNYIPSGSKIYLSGNIVPDPAIYKLGSGISSSIIVNQSPIWPDSLTVLPAAQVKDYVLAHAGARPWDRDSVDKRIISNVANGTGRIIDSQNEVGGWPNLTETHRTLTLPNNPNSDDDQDGYTNLEGWLHQMEFNGSGATSTPGGATPTTTPTQGTCPLKSLGDFNCDEKINESDLNTLLSKWMTGVNDITGDNIVNESDLNKLLGNWKTL